MGGGLTLANDLKSRSYHQQYPGCSSIININKDDAYASGKSIMFSGPFTCQ